LLQVDSDGDHVYGERAERDGVEFAAWLAAADCALTRPRVIVGEDVGGPAAPSLSHAAP